MGKKEVKPFSILLFISSIELIFIGISLEVAYATNGTNLIGFSAVSNAMGGADTAAIVDTSAINSNPALLSQISSLKADLTFSFMQPKLHHKDQFGNNRDGENNPFMLANLGFASRLESLPSLTWGIGIFSQGGFGTDFHDLNTAFGTKDDASSFLRYTKLAAAISYQVSDKFSIGVAPHVGYSDISLSLFPGTSFFNPGPDGISRTADDVVFTGIEIKDNCSRNLGLGEPFGTCPWDIVFGVKVGLLYEASKMISFGAAYTSPVNFNYDDGEIIFNFSDPVFGGLGRVTYDAKIGGFKWPRQVDVGIAIRPTDRFLIALEGGWINWNMVNTVTIKTSNPSNPLAPPTISPAPSFTFNWKDQWIFAVGIEYEAIKERLALRAGYNYGNNPVPDENLSPLTPIILEHHITGGIGYRITKAWSFDSSLIYGIKNKVTVTNTNMPFGTNAVESPSGFLFDATVGYGF